MFLKIEKSNFKMQVGLHLATWMFCIYVCVWGGGLQGQRREREETLSLSLSVSAQDQPATGFDVYSNLEIVLEKQ